MDFHIEARGSEELVSLTKSFMAMRDELREERERRARFIMGITHDLKTPLALIGGYVDAIEDGYARDPEAMRRYLGIIRQRSAALEEMIGSLIGFARMETREWKGRFERIEALPFFEELAARFAEDAELLGRRFESRVSLPGDAAFKADPLLSRRAFENIIGNSLRYTEEGGLVRIEVEAQGGRVAARVIDDGPGVPPEERERVFEPFYRGSRSRREEGSGLGLAVVSTVARAQGWSIRLGEPEGGRGLVVHVDIPLIGEAC
jgi:signal transduction histidine kinase